MKSRPERHRFSRPGREPAEAPHLISLRDPRLVVRLERAIKLDHAEHEPRREDAHAAIVEQIDAVDAALLAVAGRGDRVIAEMRIAMNDAVAQERAPPRVEQADSDGVARLLRRGLEGDERLAVEPLHRQQSPRRQALVDPRHAHERPVGEHDAIEPGDLGLALVVELFAHPLADLARHLACVDRGARAPMEREQEVEIGEIRLHRRSHVRILQLAGEPLAAEAERSVHLAERRGGRGLQIEFGETLAPVRPKLGLHAPAHERGAHRRRLRLELRQFGGEIRRDRIGDGGQHLRDLHQRALHRAQGGSERLGVRLAPAPAQPIDADPGGERAGVDAEARVARSPRAQAIGFVVVIQTRNSQKRRQRKGNIGDASINFSGADESAAK